MKNRIAFLLGALSLALSACAAEPMDGEAPEQDEQAAGAALTADEAGGPSTSTEYTYWRCSTNGGLYLTKPACQTACPTGTCRITLICRNAQGQQIPCP